MPRRKKIQIGDNKLDSKLVGEVLSQFAHRIYVDKHQDELSFLLEQRQGITKVGLDLDELFRVNAGPAKIFGGYSGPCVNTDAKIQGKVINTLTKKLPNILGGIVHGATMWAFIKEAHLAAVNNNLLSIGVMPWRGINSLLKIRDSLGPNFPKMDYLAISGEGYEDHTNLFAHCLDYLILLGGRTGALAEANSALRYDKPVISLVLENEKDLAFQNFNEGILYSRDPEEVGKFIFENLTPDQRLFYGKHISIHEFDKQTIDKIRTTFLGNSGRKTDLLRHRQILDKLIMGIPPHLAPKTEGISGGTYLGGVQAFYDSCKYMGINRSGIMSRKGIGYKIADIDHLIAYGPKWGSESEVTKRMSDIAIVLGGGGQTEKEVEMLASYGGRIGNGIPIIVIDDPIIGNWSSQRSFEHPNVHYFSSEQLSEASTYLNATMQKLHDERSNVLS